MANQESGAFSEGLGITPKWLKAAGAEPGMPYWRRWFAEAVTLRYVSYNMH
jgi:hypothetical protein